MSLGNRLAQLKSAFNSVLLDYWCALLICPALFLYVFSNDINLIALNGLIYRKACINQFNLTVCNSIKKFSAFSTLVQEESTQKMLYLNIAFLLPAIFAIIHMASIGDRRLNYQLPLLVSLLGSLGQSFVNIFAVDQAYSTCFYLLICSQIINGICGGGSLAFISSCFSHVSIYENFKSNNLPSKPKKYRSISYSICESCLLFGQFLGSFLSGYLIGNKINLEKFKQTYIISFCIYFFVFVYTILMFKYLKSKNPKAKLLSFDPNELTSQENLVEFEPQKEQKFSLKKQFKFLTETWELLRKKRK